MTVIGRWGRLATVRGPLPQIPHEHARPRTYTEAADGTRYEVSAPVSRRMWEWPLGGRDNAALAAIRQLDHDSSKGHLYWMDDTALRSNMIRPEVADPTASHLGLADAGVTVTVDGHVFDCVDGPVSVDVPTVDGDGYTVRVDAGAHAGTLVSVTVESLDGDQQTTGTIGSDTQALAGTPEQLTVGWTASTEAGVRVTVDGAAWAALQMVETAHDPGGWLLGGGIPEVVMEGLSPTLDHATPDEILWRGASVTLVEVDS